MVKRSINRLRMRTHPLTLRLTGNPDRHTELNLL